MTIDRFLGRFGQSMEPSAADYPVPQYADNPKLIIDTSDELIEYLIKSRTEPYNIYYRYQNPKKTPVQNAIVSFTNDGNIILGLTVSVSDPSSLEEILKQMALVANAEWGFWTVEQPPPPSTTQFVEMAIHSQDPKLVARTP